MNAYITDDTLDSIEGLRHAVTTRAGGVSTPPFDTLNLGLGSEDTAHAVQENRSRVAEHLGFTQLITPYQVHGADVCVVDASPPSRPRCDALITNRPGTLVGVLGADCPGVLLVDEARHALGVAHAGWRGVAAGVVAAAVHALVSHFDCEAESLRAWIGPGIGARRYEVDLKVVEAVENALPPSTDLHAENVVAPSRPGHVNLALQRAIELQLFACGLRATHVTRVVACTYDESERFYSYRRDGARTGRHALVAGWIA